MQIKVSKVVAVDSRNLPLLVCSQLSQLTLRSFCLYFHVVDNAIIIVVHLGNFNIFSDQVSNREIVIMAPSFSSSFLFENDWVMWTSYNPSFEIF